ncbi:PLP-dependent aminotransferase family protein [Pseudoalteromonas fenneropenaei]|uniref:PLP-dependent aminotransferase family protein n=1 Tax=Pseudoalteromonas fenneropenaei TaxID=1737459 RepID=A0ABV7CJ83_9GAMM
MTKSAKYQQLAQLLQNKLQQGEYQPGQALPSLRQCCELHQVSMTTALATYRQLESLGLIVASNKRGYFVAPTPKITKQHFPNFVAQTATPLLRQRLAQEPLFGFATAQLDETLMDSEHLAASIARVNRHSSKLFNYANVAGNSQLREALCQHFAAQGFNCQAARLVITQGCLDAVMTALQVTTQVGDVVAVASPCYSGLLNTLALLQRRVLEIPSTPEGLDLTQLEHALANNQVQACLLTVNQQNPTGHSLSTSQKQQLAALAKRYQCPIIEDDVFRELSHGAAIPLPLKYYDEAGWVLWCSSVSKTLAPGLRIGWCEPGRFYQPFVDCVATRSLGGNQPLQLALADYLQRGHYARHLHQVNRTLAAQTEQYLQVMQSELPAPLIPQKPHGGLVFWLNLAPLIAVDIQQLLAKQGIAVRDGDDFSTTPLYRHYLRLNFGLKLTAEIEAQLRLALRLIKAAYLKATQAQSKCQ